VVEDDAIVGESLLTQLAKESIHARRVATAKAALDALREDRFDCLILDLGLPDMDGLELLDRLDQDGGAKLPSVIVYTARALTMDETRRLEAYTDAIVLKQGSSVERLLDEIRMFAGRVSRGRAPVVAPARSAAELRGKTVLVVDDDMRTVYALSAMLRSKGFEVHVADTGIAALDSLSRHPEVDAVLMDIMMPEMDGYSAMQRIRAQPAFASLPIIALTAKAMKGDEEKCLAAGATAYLPKPVDTDRLLDALRDHIVERP
jgi:CheY-like chemotaxis protein